MYRSPESGGAIRRLVPVAGIVLAGLLATGLGAQEEAAPPQSVTVREIVPLEMVLGYIAFEMDVPDDQLVQVRRSLRGLHAKREKIVTQMLTSRMGMHEVRSRVFSLRRQMLQSLTIVLTEEQSVELFTAMGEIDEEEAAE